MQNIYNFRSCNQYDWHFTYIYQKLSKSTNALYSLTLYLIIRFRNESRYPLNSSNARMANEPN